MSETLTSLEQLKSEPELQKVSPQIWWELQKILKIKYWVEEENPFSITKEELSDLKNEISSSKNILKTLEKYLYDDYLETKLEKWWISSVNIDVVTIWIDNPRVADSKREFEEVINPFLSEYDDILDDNSKWVLKLAIANRFLSEKSGSPFESIKKDISDVWILIEWFEVKKASQKIEELKQKWASLKEIFQAILWEYKTVFDTTRNKLEWKTPEEKYAIISNNEWYRNPELIEKWASTFDVSKLYLTKTTLNDKFVWSFDMEKMKKYLLESRNKVNSAADFLSKWDWLAEFIYSNSDWFLWEWINWFVKMLLEIPILWDIFAMFLWLDPKNKLAEFDENISNFKLLKSLKSLWASSWEKWKKIEWKWVFKNIDLSSLNFNVLKWEIKQIKTNIPELKVEEYPDFWLKSFSDWYKTKEWFLLQFELSSEQKSKTKLETSDIKEAIQKWFKNYEKQKEDKKAKEQEELRKKQEEELRKKQEEAKKESLKLAWEVTSIELKLESIERIISIDYEKLSDWDSYLNYWDIINVSLDKIVNYNSWDFWKVISDEIWIMDYNSMKQEDKQFLNLFFSFIKEFIIEKKIEVSWKTLSDFFANNKAWFDEFVNLKKQKLLEEKQSKVVEKWKQEKLSWDTKKELDVVAFQQLVVDKIKSTTEITFLSSWIDLWWWKEIKFDKEKQQIKIGDNFYKIELINNRTAYKVYDIKISWENVEFIPELNVIEQLWYKSEDWIVSKAKVINWIDDLFKTSKYENWDKEKTYLQISKV